MIRANLTIAFLAIIWLGIQSAAAQTSQPALSVQLNDLDKKADQIADLSADFSQKKITTLTTEPLISSGTVRATGDLARWDTQSPSPSVLFSNGKELRLYYPSQNLEEIYPIGQHVSNLLSSPLPKFKTLVADFKIERADTSALTDAGDLPHVDNLIILRLVPSDQFLRQHIQQVLLAIDADRAALVAMQTTDADGDKTDLIFQHVKTNTGIKPADLDLQVPPGTTISHPLQGAATAP